MKRYLFSNKTFPCLIILWNVNHIPTTCLSCFIPQPNRWASPNINRYKYWDAANRFQSYYETTAACRFHRVETPRGWNIWRKLDPTKHIVAVKSFDLKLWQMNFRILGTGGTHPQPQETGLKPVHRHHLQASIAWEALDGNQTWLKSRQGLLWIPGRSPVLLQWSSMILRSCKGLILPVEATLACTWWV